MQTFLPEPSYTLSALRLDRQRLGKQRVEALQILNALIDGKGWVNHPATRMWRGHELSLALYGMLVCKVWKDQGYKDTCQTKIYNKVGRPNLIVMGQAPRPDWFGDAAFHLSHRSNLLRKKPEHYSQFWPDDPDDLPYIWPVND